MRPRNKKQERGRRQQSCEPLPQDARRSVERLGPQRESRFGQEMKAIKVGMLRMRIFLIARRRYLCRVEQDFPGTPLPEQAPHGTFLARDSNQRALCATADFNRYCSDGGDVERARRIVVRVRRKKRRKFTGFGTESLPAVSITVIDDGASVKNLLYPPNILSRDAQNHVDEFGQAKYLLHNGAHRDIASVFLREAYRDGLRQWHVDCGRRRLPVRKGKNQGGSAQFQ